MELRSIILAARNEYNEECKEKEGEKMIGEIRKNPSLLFTIKNPSIAEQKAALLSDISILGRIEVQNKKIVEYALGNAEAMKYVKEQTPEICKFALRQNIEAMKYIKDQTEDLCRYAIDIDPETIRFMKNPSLDVCKKAILYDAELIRFVENQTPELCMMAVKKYGGAIDYIKDQTPELCVAALENYPQSLAYIKDQTPELCMMAVKKDGTTLASVKKEYKTPELCLEAIKETPHASYYCEIKDEEFWVKAAKISPYIIGDIHQTPKICLAALETNGEAIKFIDNPTKEMCLIAVKQNSENLRYISNVPDVDVYVQALLGCNSKEDVENLFYYVLWGSKEKVIKLLEEKWKQTSK